MPDFDINELCEQAEVTARTVHFYVQQGLLPPAGAPGPGARYTDGHVSRIRLIRLLQKQHLPLAEIAKRIKGLTDGEVDALVKETRQRREEEPGSALDYIRGVLGEPDASVPDGQPAPAAPQASLVHRLRAHLTSHATSAPPAPVRSQWERFTIVDGIEVHVRRPMSRIEQRKFDKLMTAARDIFDDSEGEGQS